jgi:hypothetical protein
VQGSVSVVPLVRVIRLIVATSDTSLPSASISCVSAHCPVAKTGQPLAVNRSTLPRGHLLHLGEPGSLSG